MNLRSLLRSLLNSRSILLPLLLIMVPLILVAQDASDKETENKIVEELDSMIESHPYRFSIFRIGPRISLNGGYDSNALYVPGALPESDSFTNIAPGVDAAVKLGRRGFFEIREDLNFVFYNKQDNLTDVHNTTSGRAVFGSRRMLFTLGGGYSKRKTYYNYEYDLPVDQQSIAAQASLIFQLTATTELSLQYSLSDIEFQPIDGIELIIPPPPDNTTREFGFGMSQELGRIFSLSAVGAVGTIDFQDVTRFDSHWAISVMILS